MNERIINNLFSDTNYIRVFLLLFMSLKDIHTWDVAVASDGALMLMDSDGTVELSPQETQKFTDLHALSYDPSFQRMFFSVNEHNTSIFAFDLQNNSLTPLVPRQEQEVQGIAYDVITSTLFWTDGNGHSVWKRSLLDDEKPVELVLSYNRSVTMGIAVSYCKRLLFWANSNYADASIDRANLDGSGHTRLITADVFQPMGVTIDEPYGKLYWTDDQTGIYYRIERSNFDGSDRELVIRRTHQEPFGIAALNDVIFWTDTIQKSVWTLSSDMSFPNHTKAKIDPNIFHKFDVFVPKGIATRINATFECDSILKVPTSKVDVPHDEPQPEADPDYCLNSGVFVLDQCKCKNGFTGQRCEESACHNYCLYSGACYIDKKGDPVCRCLPGYDGTRCNIYLCDGYCLNDGHCGINESVPVCKCRDGYRGQRCEFISEDECHRLCSEESSTPGCNCEFLRFQNSTLAEELRASPCEEQQIVIISLTCFCASAMLVIVFLTRRVCVLRRRPRIKKRIIVNKAIKSQTPLTARPHPSPPTEQCEITIENCCNMNICETPCFEPNLRSSRSSSSSTKKTEDRKNLLKNMEEEPGGSDGGYS